MATQKGVTQSGADGARCNGLLEHYLRIDAEKWHAASEPRPARKGEEEEEDEAVYWVDNDTLKSDAVGVKYRRSQNLDDHHPSVAQFGTMVWGVRVSPDWLKVGKLFLPMKVRNVTVLIRQPDMVFSDDEDDAPSRKKSGPLTPRDRKYAQQPKQPKPVEWTNDTQCADVMREWWFEPGSGAPYVVVAQRVAIRTSPDADAALQGCLYKDEVVELFDWDPTRRWRQVQKPSDLDFKKRVPSAWETGWMLLDHPELGALLRPQGMQFQQEPLNPLCVAVFESNLVDVQMFLLSGMSPDSREVDGRTALMIAAALNRLDCAVLLLQAGADVTLESTREGSTALRHASEPEMQALLEALSGSEQYDETNLIAAYRQMQPETLSTAEAIIAKAERERQERIEREEEERLQKERELRQREERLKKHQERYEASKRKTEERERDRLRLEKAAEEQRLLDQQAEEYDAWQAAERGGLFEVTRRKGVPVYQQPSMNSREIGIEPLGSTIELHEHDSTGRWRKAVGHEFEGTLSGWACVRGQYDEEDTWVRPVG